MNFFINGVQNLLYFTQISANYVVAAAVMEASKLGADIESLFFTMKKCLLEVRPRTN